MTSEEKRRTTKWTPKPRTRSRPSASSKPRSSRGTREPSLAYRTAMLRVAVIGMGPIGNLHARIYSDDPLAELIGVCDIKKNRADDAARRLRVPAFYDTPALL